MFHPFVKTRCCVLALALAAGAPEILHAQIPLSGGEYSQNFDSLASSGAAAWTNNATLPGWYASKSVAPHEVTNYLAGAGSDTKGGLYSFGDTGSGERAFGSLASSGPGRLAYGLRFTNDTGVTQTRFAVSCTGEQWRAANTNVQTLSFSFQIGVSLTNADAPGDQTWTACPALDFHSPNTNTGRTLKGNDPANQAVFTNVLLPGVAVPPGQELFLRWFDVDDPGFDHGLAIDNLTVSFSAAATSDASTNGAFSLLTYNTHGHSIEYWGTNSAQVRAIGRQLAYLKPDIVSLNEIPDTNTWEMENWIAAFLPGYFLATNSASDGYIRSVIASRWPITRSQSRLHDSDLSAYGYTNFGFTRDLFEAEIAVPAFPRPLHVFAVHLKSSQDAESSARRAAEAGAISNFLTTVFRPENPADPYLVCGDMNEDLARAPETNPQTLQRLVSAPTGLNLTTPLNPFTGSEMTFSIQAGSLSRRYDYILPCDLLFSNLAGCEVFQTDQLASPPPPLTPDDDRRASDHLPVLMVFNNPYDKPFRLLGLICSNRNVTLTWEAIAGRTYLLEASTNLTTWLGWASNLTATEQVFTYSTNSPDEARFFRVGRMP